MRKWWKRSVSFFLIPLTRWYLKKPREYAYHEIKIRVLPGVFHPGLFFSTRVLLTFLSDQELVGKKILELGAGSGLIALYAASKGAEVTASDVSLGALKNIEYNSVQNKLKVKVVESDLFDRIDSSDYDWIVINPPFYPRDPTNESERAWFCGKDFDYFIKLFKQLEGKVDHKKNVIMVLSEDCDAIAIQAIAMQSGLKLDKIFTGNGWWEKNDIYKIAAK